METNENSMYIETDLGVIDPNVSESSRLLRLVPLPLPSPVTGRHVLAAELAEKLSKFRKSFVIDLYLEQERHMLDTEELKFYCVRPFDMRLQAIYSVLMGATQEEAIAVAVGRHSILSVWRDMVTTEDLSNAIDIKIVEKMVRDLDLRERQDNHVKSQDILIKGGILAISNCTVSSQVMSLSRDTLKEVVIMKQTGTCPTFTAENLLLAFPSVCVLVCSNLEGRGRHITIGKNEFMTAVERSLKMDHTLAHAIRVAIYYHTFVCFSRKSKHHVYVSCIRNQSVIAEMKSVVLPIILNSIPVIPYEACWFGLIVRMAVATIGLLDVTMERESEQFVKLRNAEADLEEMITTTEVNSSVLDSFQKTAAFYLGILDVALPNLKVLDLEAFQRCVDNYTAEYNRGKSLVSE